MNDLPNRWHLYQFLRENRLERIAENDEREGDKFGDCIYPRVQNEAVRTIEITDPRM